MAGGVSLSFVRALARPVFPFIIYETRPREHGARDKGESVEAKRKNGRVKGRNAKEGEKKERREERRTRDWRTWKKRRGGLGRPERRKKRVETGSRKEREKKGRGRATAWKMRDERRAR